MAGPFAKRIAFSICAGVRVTRLPALAFPIHALKVAVADRIFHLLAALAYCCYMYYVHVGPRQVWEYLGLLPRDFDSFDTACCLVFSMLPVTLMPTTINRFSAFINWCIYLIVYVPTVLYPVLPSLHPNMHTLATAIFVSFLIVIGLTAIDIRLLRIQLSAHAWRVLFNLSYLSLAVYSLSVFASMLTLLDVTDVYGKRSLVGDFTEGTLTDYAVNILSGSFCLLLMSIGLQHRMRWLVGVSMVGQVFACATLAQKSILLLFHINTNPTYGIATAGIAGVLLIGIQKLDVMRVVDAMIPEDNLAVTCGAARPNVISLANSSHFTTLLTNGLLVLIFFSAAWRERSGRVLVISSEQ